MEQQVTELQTTVMITPIEEEIGLISRKARAVALAATAMCRLYGPRNGCLCSNGKSRCHAATLYNDYGLAVIGALDKAGFLKT
jgi:hypothetical protein